MTRWERLHNAVATPTAISLAACWSTRPSAGARSLRNTSKTSRRPGRCCWSRRSGASDEPVEGLVERLETRRVVLQLGGANLGDVLDVACARFLRCAGGPTAAQLSKALRERWAESSPVVGAGVAVPHLPLAGAPVEAALVTLAAPLQGRPPTGCGRRRSWCCCRRSTQAGGRDRARRRAQADPQSAQKRSTATPCSSPPGTGESSRCTTTSRPSSTHAVEATVPGWNQ